MRFIIPTYCYVFLIGCQNSHTNKDNQDQTQQPSVEAKQVAAKATCPILNSRSGQRVGIHKLNKDGQSSGEKTGISEGNNDILTSFITDTQMFIWEAVDSASEGVKLCHVGELPEACTFINNAVLAPPGNKGVEESAKGRTLSLSAVDSTTKTISINISPDNKALQISPCKL